MGRHRERRFGRRPEDECASNNVSPVPPSIRKERRSSGQRTNARVADELALRNGCERGSHHNEYHHQGSSRNGRNIISRRHAKMNRHTILNCVLVVAWVTVAYFNYFISQSTSDIVILGGKDKQQPSNWSRRKMASFQSKVVPTDEKAEMFFRTGQLPGNNQRLSRFINGPKTQNIGDAGHSKGGPSQEPKRNKLLHGVKSTNGTEDIWPPLSSLIDVNGNIADGVDISGFLDFSIIGFPKTGTTSLLRHLSDLTNSLPKEHCDLVVNDTVKLVSVIYDDHAQRIQRAKDGVISENQLRGIKCPQDISSDWSMHNYAKYFPRTKLIVGIRHPIFWFESLYNFRVSNVPWKKMPPTSKLKRCGPGSQGVCAWRANFHDFLARLGKTPLSSSTELKLLSLGNHPVQSSVGPVFLYELSQLSEVKFRQDLRDFLGLTKDIPPFPVVDTSGRFDHVTAVKQRTAKEKIDICNREHDAIRSVLMEKATSASIWIRDYFLESEDVFVSNRPHFEAMVKSWMHDPCG